MTENISTETETETVTPTIEPVEPPEAQEVAPEATDTSPDDLEEIPSGNREAAKYRRQLRDAEAERDALVAEFETKHDQLNQQLAVARTAMLAQHKRSKFIQDGAINEVFPNPNAMFNDDGTINEEAYNAAFNEARDNRNYLFVKMIIPAEGGSPSNRIDGNSWEKAFKPATK